MFFGVFWVSSMSGVVDVFLLDCWAAWSSGYLNGICVGCSFSLKQRKAIERKNGRVTPCNRPGTEELRQSQKNRGPCFFSLCILSVLHFFVVQSPEFKRGTHAKDLQTKSFIRQPLCKPKPQVACPLSFDEAKLWQGQSGP